MKQKTEKSKKLSKIEEANNKAAAGWKDRINEAMKEQRLSQRKLADLASLGSTSVRHLITQADTVSLESLRRIANALNVPLGFLSAGVVGQLEGDDLHRRVRLIKVHLPNEELEKRPETDHGVIAVLVAGMPERLYALRMTDNSMTPFGQNAPIDPEHVVLRSETVVWSPEIKAQPGSLCVAKVQDALVVRLLSLNDDGKNVLVPLNSNYPRSVVTPSHILGSVLLTHRTHQPT